MLSYKPQHVLSRILFIMVLIVTRKVNKSRGTLFYSRKTWHKILLKNYLARTTRGSCQDIDQGVINTTSLLLVFLLVRSVSSKTMKKTQVGVFRTDFSIDYLSRKYLASAYGS